VTPGPLDGRGRAQPGHPPPSAPPVRLEPIFAFIERIDRRRRHIRRIRAKGGILGLELTRWGGAPVTLGDGTRVNRGDPVGELHLENHDLKRFAPEAGLSAAFQAGRDDLAALAGWAARRAPGPVPVAYHGATILWPLAHRFAFEILERPPTFRVRLEDWYGRGILARWASGGRGRLRRGRGRLATRDAWLSASELQRRFVAEQPSG
jgi:hypothetical protein